MMYSKILKTRHWVLFFIALLGHGLYVVFPSEYSLSIALINSVGVLIIVGWVNILGNALVNMPKEGKPFDNTLFNINCILVAGFLIIVTMLSLREDFKFDGILSLLGFYLLYALVHIYSFPMKVLKTIEMGKTARAKEYWRLALLLYFWPIGIWIIQPRINAIAENN